MIYLSGYFTNLSKVHTGPCTHSFVVTGRLIFQSVFIFCIALASAVLLGVDQWGGFSSPILLICPAWLASAHYWYFLVLQVFLSNTLAFRKIPWGLRSVLGGSTSTFLYATFSEEDLKWWENLLSISARTDEVNPPSLLGVLRSCRWVADHPTALIW